MVLLWFTIDLCIAIGTYVVAASFTQWLHVLLVSTSHWFRKANYHSTCVLYDIHSLRVQYGYQQEWVSSFQYSYRIWYGFKNSLALIKKDPYKHCHDFSVGLSFLFEAILFFKLLPELKIVWNDTVVDKCHSFFMIKMWMRIHISLITMCSPSSMSNRKKLIVFTLALQLQSLYTITAKSISRCELIQFEFLCLWIDAYDSTWVVASWLKNS